MKREYTKEEYSSSAPYAEVCELTDPFEREIRINELAEAARRVGVTNFRLMLSRYVKSQDSKRKDQETGGKYSAFEAQMICLDTGDWEASDTMIYRSTARGSQVACTHPIMPVKRLRNIESGEIKIRLAFRRGKTSARKMWIETTQPFDVISSARNIVSLSKLGISVQSGERAQALVDYLADVMDRNYDKIDEARATSRLGWTTEGFAPYVDGLEFDGDPGFERAYNSVRISGDFDAWLDGARRARSESLAARIVLAASFAAPLIKPLCCLPFFVHLWGMESGTGKSVGLKLAASVWGDPSFGAYVKTFHSTETGFEAFAGFLHDLPVCIDELQLSKDSRGNSRFDVYGLSAGTGKLRSNSSLTVANAKNWNTCFLTTGETPIVNDQDGAGALNRVIEVECKRGTAVVRDGHAMAELLHNHFGHAGKAWINYLTKDGVLDRVAQLYDTYCTACMSQGATDKQAMAAALLLTADALATEEIFRDGLALTADDLAEYLKSANEVSASQRGYEYICDWVSANAIHFKIDAIERYGLTDSGDDETRIDPGALGGKKQYVWIIRGVFQQICASGGINSKALLSQLKSAGLIRTRKKNNTLTRRIDGIPTEFVVLRLPDDYEEKPEQDDCDHEDYTTFEGFSVGDSLSCVDPLDTIPTGF